MDANTDRMPGDAEAAAAAAAMQETYGRRLEHAVGDTVTFRLVGDDAPKTGKVEGVAESGSDYLIHADGRLWFVTEAEILRV